MVGVEQPGVPHLERHFVAVRRVAVEVPGHGRAVDAGDAGKQRLDDIEFRQPVVVGVNQPAVVRADLAVRRQLVKSIGYAGGSVREVAGENVVAGEAHQVGDIAIGGVRVRGIEQVIAVGVDIHAARSKRAKLRPAVDGEAGDEIAARGGVPAGEGGCAVGLRGVAFAVQLIAGGILQVVIDGQREAIIGQWAGEDNLDGGRRNSTEHWRIVDEDDL